MAYVPISMISVYNPIVCCLQETMFTIDDCVIRGFNCINLTSCDIGGRACGGVLVLARGGIPYSQHYSTSEECHHIHF